MITDAPVLIINEAEVLERQATHLVGTLGHVAEGKSSFIRALTGIKTQRHTKEQDRNITIHLGYANTRIYQNTDTGELRAVQLKEPAPPGWQLIAHLSFVDCPGHEAYLATMLGGASIMDTACLIVAANQEVIPQPQTVEHLIAAELMGLSTIAVLQNKLDLMTPVAAQESRGKICAFTTGTIAESAPVLPISAQHGWGVERVLEWLTGLPPPPRDFTAPARLTCVRSFDINPQGCVEVAAPKPLIGAIIGGTLDRGVLAVGDWIEVRPGVLSMGAHGGIVAQPLMTRVRGIRCESADLPYAVPGSLIAISTDLDPALSIANGMLGQRIGVPGTLPPIAGQLSIRYKPLDRHGSHAFTPPVSGTVLTICSNVMTITGTVAFADSTGRIRVDLDRPLCIDKGERVGIMRMHPEAGRELLAGSGKVLRVTPWEHINEPEGADLAISPHRTVKWVPMDRPEWIRRAPSYEEMLESVMTRKRIIGKKQSQLILPDIVLHHTKHFTIWTTYQEMVRALDKGGSEKTITYENHFHKWLFAELQVGLRPTSEGTLEIRGRYRAEDLESLLRRYVALFKRCGQCAGHNTCLIKERILKLRCNTCKSDNVIPE